jgi:hypothetical protein
MLFPDLHHKMCEAHRCVKHLEKICSVHGGHLICINWEEYYAYASRVGGKLCLLISVRTFPVLRGRHKNPPIHSPRDVGS